MKGPLSCSDVLGDHGPNVPGPRLQRLNLYHVVHLCSFVIPELNNFEAGRNRLALDLNQC